MFGFDSGLPIASTGEFPGYVNPADPVGETDVMIRLVDDDVVDELARRRGRRPQPPQ